MSMTVHMVLEDFALSIADVLLMQRKFLSQYYQTRHDLIEATGIKLIEIHYANVYHDKFIEKLIQTYKLK